MAIGTIVPGETVTGKFPASSTGSIVGTYTFPGIANKRATLHASCAGYTAETLTIRVSRNGVVLASALAVLSLVIPATDTYTVDLITP